MRCSLWGPWGLYRASIGLNRTSRRTYRPLQPGRGFQAPPASSAWYVRGIWAKPSERNYGLCCRTSRRVPRRFMESYAMNTILRMRGPFKRTLEPQSLQRRLCIQIQASEVLVSLDTLVVTHFLFPLSFKVYLRSAGGDSKDVTESCVRFLW